MKLIIAEFLRTLKERNELDRLLPDLLVEMGYVPLAKPQTGNRQFGVDLAARGKDPRSGIDELLLAVIKKGDIGRTEWDGGEQSVRRSINEILDMYLKSHVEPQDKGKNVHIVVVANGELKQVVQASWCGFIADVQPRANVEFWGIDQLSELIETYLLDEHVFLDEDRKQLRRALALAGDRDYDRRDLYRLFLRTLGLSSTGELAPPPEDGQSLAQGVADCESVCARLCLVGTGRRGRQAGSHSNGESAIMGMASSPAVRRCKPEGGNGRGLRHALDRLSDRLQELL